MLKLDKKTLDSLVKRWASNDDTLTLEEKVVALDRVVRRLLLLQKSKSSKEDKRN